jgi:hypothetical protein
MEMKGIGEGIGDIFNNVFPRFRIKLDMLQECVDGNGKHLQDEEYP